MARFNPDSEDHSDPLQRDSQILEPSNEYK